MSELLRRWARVLIIDRVRLAALAPAATLGVMLAFASSVAAATPSGGPVRFWSVNNVRQGAGEAKLASGAQGAGALHKLFDLGLSAFNFEKVGPNPDPYQSPVDGRASGEVFSSADGARYSVAAQAPVLDPHRANSPKGGVTHLDEYQAYEKRSGDASLRITITDAVIEAIDSSRGEASECVQIIRCFPIRSIVRFHARAYAASADGDFFNVGGIAFVTGHFGAWDARVATLADSQAPVWTSRDFAELHDCADPACVDIEGPGDSQYLLGPRTLRIPLASVRVGELFGVHVSLEAEAVDNRGVESGALAYLRDPQERGPALLEANGLTRRGKPNFQEPASKTQKLARCARAVSRHAGTVQLSAPAFTVSESDHDPLVLVTRIGGSRGATSVMAQTSGGTARSGTDFKPTRTLVRFENGDSSPRLVEVPIREDRSRESPESFKVSLSEIQCAKLGKQRSASVTILDDDQPPPPPPPAFTIGGTVDGLQGSGLVLTNFGAPLPVSANGGFTFPGTASEGQQYEIHVSTQPSNPNQVCTVQNGSGQVSSANVTNIAVHCAAVAAAPGTGTAPSGTSPSGLDTTFGDTGRVSTPGSGEARAVLIQPDGRIVTVGPREVGVNFHFDFGATRYDAAGNLDSSFGTGGIATTDLGGNDDEANDAALLPNGGFVVVGQADPAGLAHADFGVVRYTPDGSPDPGFNTTGIVTTDIGGRGDVANAVAVQPDGKIVVAGEAETAPGRFDFAVVRYNPDGTLDPGFDGDGIVTTDLGSGSDVANAIALQGDGKIVVAGGTDEDVALARYLPDGKLDPTFNGSGTVVSNIGTNLANGVAITPGGTILIAGTRSGPNGLDAIVAGFTTSGALDLRFGHGGVAQADLSGQDDFGNDLALDAQGNIVVVGTSDDPCSSPACGPTPPPPTGPDIALVRFTPDGTLDTTFADHGILMADFQGASDNGDALAIDPQGRIVAAGTSRDQFALIRANP